MQQTLATASTITDASQEELNTEVVYLTTDAELVQQGEEQIQQLQQVHGIPQVHEVHQVQEVQQVHEMQHVEQVELNDFEGQETEVHYVPIVTSEEETVANTLAHLGQ